MEDPRHSFAKICRGFTDYIRSPCTVTWN